MKVRLISHSTPVENTGLESIQDLVAFCARVSNPTNQLNTGTADKLIQYLLTHKHFSPFEMANICLELETTRDIARQILRHRSFTFQEFSQRYADPTAAMEFVYREARLQDTKNRQNSLEVDDSNLHEQWIAKQKTVADTALEAYEWATIRGIAKEVARAVLPEGLCVSRLYMNGSIRSWIHYLDVRTDASTQKEHRLVALECAKAIAVVFPLINTLPPTTKE